MDRLRKKWFKKYDFKYFAAIEYFLSSLDGKVGEKLYKFYLYKIFKPYQHYIGWQKFREGMRLYESGMTIEHESFEKQLLSEV